MKAVHEFNGLQAYILLSGLGEFGFIKNTMARYGAIIGGLSTTLFFVVVTPEMVWLAAALFILARVCSRITGLMMDALLSDVSQGDDWVAHNVSAKAVTLGYTGMLVFLVCVAPIVVAPSFLSLDSESEKLWFEQRIPLGLCGVWWSIFAYVAFSWLDVYPGRPLPLRASKGSKASQLVWMVRTGIMEQYTALRTIFQFPDVGMFLLSWMFLSDASSTATSMAVLVADALGLSIVQQGAAAVVGLFAAGIGMTAFRFLVKQDFLTPFWALIVNTAMLTISVCFVPFITEAWQVYIIAGIAGLNVGSVASFTRSILSTMIPDGMQSNFFAVYELTQKGTSWIGPLVIGAVTSALNDSSDQTFVNVTVGTIVAEVIIGAPLFFCVNVRRGQQLAVDHAARRDGRSTESPMSTAGGSDASTTQRPTASPGKGLGEHITKGGGVSAESPLSPQPAREEGNPMGTLLDSNTASDATTVSGSFSMPREVELSASGLPIPKGSRGGSASNAVGKKAPSPEAHRLSTSAPGWRDGALQPAAAATTADSPPVASSSAHSSGASTPSQAASAASSAGGAAAGGGAGGVANERGVVDADQLPHHVTSAAHFNIRPNSVSRRVADSSSAVEGGGVAPHSAPPAVSGMQEYESSLAEENKRRGGAPGTPRSVFRRPPGKRPPSMMVDDVDALYPASSPLRGNTLPSTLEAPLQDEERKRVPSGSMGPRGVVSGHSKNGPTTVRSPLGQ